MMDPTLPVNHVELPSSVAGTKRKRGARDKSEVSPTPPGSRDYASPTPENVVLSAPHASKDRPRLTISRHPAFVPIPGTGDPPLCTTESVLMNRALNSVGFRYYPAGLAEPGSTLPYRTIESRPTSVRVSWEDRSAFIRVTEDGLGLGGQGGFRSARCNVPVREGKWYCEVLIEKGGGESARQQGVRDGAHVRLGWGRREAPLNGPVGLDGYSYGIRDKTGEKVTLSRPKPYGKPFKSGDVVGLYISLPPHRRPDPDDPLDPAHMQRRRIAIESRGQEYWESLEVPPSREMAALMETKTKPKPSSTKNPPDSTISRGSPSKKNAADSIPGPPRQQKQKPRELRPLPTLGPDSVIAFFVNGECQGVAYQDLYSFLQLRQEAKKEKVKKKESYIRQHSENSFDDGTLGYYPFISLYNDARVRLNPGPHFKFTPPNDIDEVLTNSQFTTAQVALDAKVRIWRPLCERYPEFMNEMWRQDEADERDAKIAAVEQAKIDAEEAGKLAIKAKKREQALDRKRAREASKAAKTEADASYTVIDNRFSADVDALLESAISPPEVYYSEGDSFTRSREGSTDLYYSNESPAFDAEMDYNGDTGATTPVSYDGEEGESYDDAEDAEGESEAAGEWAPDTTNWQFSISVPFHMNSRGGNTEQFPDRNE